MTDIEYGYNIPPGEYLCQVAEVRTRKTKALYTMLAFRLVVIGGKYDGEHAAWDNLIFSPRGMNYCRRVLGVLDVAVPREPAETEYVCRALVGKRALVKIKPAEYLDADGVLIQRNEVPYDGYSPIPEPGSNADILERVVRDAEAMQSKVTADDCKVTWPPAVDCQQHEFCRTESGRVLILVSTLVALWDTDELKTEAGRELVKTILAKMDVDVEAKP